MVKQFNQKVDHIKKEEIAIDNLKAKYNQLMSGNKAPSSLTAMESQLKKNEKELTSLEQQYNEVISKMESNQVEIDFAKGLGDNIQVSKLSGEQVGLDNQSIILATQLENARDKSEKLKQSLSELKANPQASMEIQNLKAKIDLAQKSLENSKAEANELAKNIQKSGKTQFKGFGINTASLSEGFENIGNKVDRFKKRMTRLISTAMIFRLLRNSLTSLSNGFISLLKSNDTFSSSLNQIKANLMTAFAPIYNYVLPAINTLMNALSRITGTIAAFVSGVFGQTASQAQKNAKSLYDQANATKEVNDAQENLASFDKLEVNNDDNKNKNGGSGGIDFNKADLPEVDNGILNFLNSIKELLRQIRFDGFIAGIKNLWKSLKPFAVNIGKGLFWFVENVLIPLTNWTINDLLPSFMNILAGALDILNQAIEDVKPLFMWLWENILKPIAEWTGGAIVTILNGIGDALKWIADNEIAMTLLESLAVAIGLVSGALAIYNGVMTICNIVTGIFTGIMAVLTSPITLVIVAIASLIAVIALCIKYWDDIKNAASICWSWIVSVWEGAKQWFNDYVVQPILNIFGPAFRVLIDGAKQTWEGIKQVFRNVASFFGDVFGSAWNKVKAVFSTGGKVFDGIKEGIIKAFKAVVNALIRGINTVVGMPFKGLNNILQKIHDISFLGISPFTWLNWRAPIPEMPYLATGAVIPPNKKFAAVLGDQRNGTNLEAPESLIRKIVREESGGTKDIILKDVTFIIQADTGEEFGRASLKSLHLLQNIDGKAYVLN